MNGPISTRLCFSHSLGFMLLHGLFYYLFTILSKGSSICLASCLLYCDFSSNFHSQIIKQLYSRNNLEEKTVSLYVYHHYAVLHMHTKKWPALDLIFSYICKCCSISAGWLFIGTKSSVVKKTCEKKYYWRIFL